MNLLRALSLAAIAAATVAAFVLTERLKLRPAPIRGTMIIAPDQTRRRTPSILHTISPSCTCATHQALLRFELRRPDRLTVYVLDSSNHPVRRLAQNEPAKPGVNQGFLWDGRTQQGRFAADGIYRFRVHLAGEHTTITFPNLLRLDTKPPRIAVISARVIHVVSRHRGRLYRLEIRYTVSEPAHAELYLNGHRVVLTRFNRRTDILKWTWTPGHPKRRSSGLVQGQLGAEDDAGNQTPTQDRVSILIPLDADQQVGPVPHARIIRKGSNPQGPLGIR